MKSIAIAAGLILGAVSVAWVSRLPARPPVAVRGASAGPVVPAAPLPGTPQTVNQFLPPAQPHPWQLATIIVRTETQRLEFPAGQAPTHPGHWGSPGSSSKEFLSDGTFQFYWDTFDFAIDPNVLNGRVIQSATNNAALQRAFWGINHGAM